jgi:hypothetical protein
MNTFPTPQELLIISGWGVYPRLLADGARAAGVKRISVLGFSGSTCRSTCRAADDVRMIPFGKIGLFKDAVTKSGCRQAVLAGQINPLCLFRSRLDGALMRELATIKIRNAHTLFRRLIEELQELGVEVLPASLFMAGHIPAPGVLTTRPPDGREAADIAFGNRIALRVCDLDIGQCVVVKDGVVLAVEGFEGTNATIRRGGAIARQGAVVVKVAKQDHDMRFDIPVIGAKTIAVMRNAKISSLSVQAGRTIILDMPEVIRLANRLNIAIQAVDSGLDLAPTV